jgi:hypothetical protein
MKSDYPNHRGVNMSTALNSVSVSCGASSAALGASLCKFLQKYGLDVILDGPAGTHTATEWGIDKSAIIDSAFDDTWSHCIVLLDRSYFDDKWYNYRRERLLQINFKRRGFILPVQVGEEEIDIHGLTYLLGKIKVASGNAENGAETIANSFLEKISDIERHSPTLLERPIDFEKILHLYNENLILHPIDHYVDKGRKIGYQFFRANDGTFSP